MLERGVINNRARAQQIIDFSGLKFNTITPTDIDGFIEYHNKLFILIEAKYKDTIMPGGQKLALERMCDSLSKDKPTILFLGTHEFEVNEDIDCANITVSKFYFKREWKSWNVITSMKSAIISFINKYGGER